MGEDTEGEARARAAIARFKTVQATVAIADPNVVGALVASAAAEVVEAKKVSKLDREKVAVKVKEFVIEIAANDDDEEVHLDSALMDAGIDTAPLALLTLGGNRLVLLTEC